MDINSIIAYNVIYTQYEIGLTMFISILPLLMLLGLSSPSYAMPMDSGDSLNFLTQLNEAALLIVWSVGLFTYVIGMVKIRMASVDPFRHSIPLSVFYIFLGVLFISYALGMSGQYYGEQSLFYGVSPSKSSIINAVIWAIVAVVFVLSMRSFIYLMRDNFATDTLLYECDVNTGRKKEVAIETLMGVREDLMTRLDTLLSGFSEASSKDIILSTESITALTEQAIKNAELRIELAEDAEEVSAVMKQFWLMADKAEIHLKSISER